MAREIAMTDGAALRTEDIGTVHDQFFTLHDFRLANGAVLPEAKIVYETYGRLASDGRNAVLITHGYTGSHHAAGRNPANGNQPGSLEWVDRPRQADRHRPAVRRRFQYAGFVLRLDQCRLSQSADRRALRAGFSEPHGARHR